MFGSGRECYNCHQLGHHQRDCLKRTLLIEEDHDDVEIEGEHVLEGECSEDEYSDHLNVIRESLVQLDPFQQRDNPSHVSIVRCAMSLPQQAADWRRTTILQFLVKINKKFCKVLVDSGSSINAIFQKTITRTGLKVIPHPRPYNVSWIDSTSLSIKKRCKVPLHIVGTRSEIWCDVSLWTLEVLFWDGLGCLTRMLLFMVNLTHVFFSMREKNIASNLLNQGTIQLQTRSQWLINTFTS